MRRKVSRRETLRAGAALAALTALPACGPIGSGLARLVEDVPDGIAPPEGAAADTAFHLLSRAAYGPRPGDVARVVATGRAAWIEEQLVPSMIDDTACELRLADCDLADEPSQELTSVQEDLVERQLARAALIRAVHSKRRLLEVMVGFWSDHFSIDTGKQGCARTKPWDDQSVVRRHALGRFRDLLGASALSPAMLFYLDGAANVAPADGRRPNENYARELLELHTLGVHGGYTQRDIEEAARCLTGWTVEDRGFPHLLSRGEVVFRADLHDDGDKVVLGTKIPAGGGAHDVERLLDLVASHPATQRRIATKLCRRLVADPPPTTAVDLATAKFSQTDGDIAAMLRCILGSREFEESRGAKVKRPFEFVVSALRVTGAECRGSAQDLDFLTRMGHVPFRWPTPDGYPEEPEPWMGTLLWRWNFALALASDRLGATKTDLESLARRAGLDPQRTSPADLAPLLLGRPATREERDVVETYAARPGGSPGMRRRESVALLLASPAFQVT